VFQRIISLLPESAYYPKDQLTDKPERFFVNETIREKILLNYSKEIPYAEIVTEEFFEDENIKNWSLIMVERETQKELLSDIKELLKKVGMEARADLEKFFENKSIEYVKVNKNWRSNEHVKGFGYNQ
jgi:GTP-binding protein Era